MSGTSQTLIKSGHESREKTVLWGFAVEVYRRGAKPRLRWRWGRIAATMSLALVLAYTTFSAALYFYVKERRQFDAVTVGQIITWPFNRASFRETMGEYFIERGKQELEDQNFSGAFYFLRAGLARAPANLEARLILAELYEYGLRRPDLAIDLLEGGVKHHLNNIDYLRTTLAMMMRGQMDEEVMKLAELYLPLETPPEAGDAGDGATLDAPHEQQRWRQTLAFAAAQANYYRGHYDHAEDILRAYNLFDEIEGIHLRSLLQWERGREIEAIAILEQGIRRQGQLDRFLLQLSRFHRERGEIDDARRYSVLRAINNPDNPAARVDLLHSFHLMGDQQRLEAELDSLLRTRGDQENLLRLIGNFAAETGNEALAQRIYERAIVSHYNPAIFILFKLEAQLVAENYPQALALSEEIAAEQPDWLASRRSVFNSLRAIANFGTNRVDLGQLYLNELYADPNLRVGTLLAVSRRLAKMGLPERAVNVLQTAHQRDPRNQAALAALITARIEHQRTGDLPKLVLSLMEMRRPSPVVLRQIQAEISRDRHLFDADQEKVLEQLRLKIAALDS